jgi:hypothetical protein
MAQKVLLIQLNGKVITTKLVLKQQIQYILILITIPITLAQVHLQLYFIPERGIN